MRQALCLLALLVAAGASAEDRPPMLSAEAHGTWAAIGQLNAAGYARRRLCTGTLIAPDLVLSAAHCVVRSDGTPIPLGDLRFVAGYLRGEYAAVARVANVSVADAWMAAARAGRSDIARDIALVRLAAPMDGVTPLPAAEPSQAARIRILGYRRDRPHALSDTGSCDHTAVAPGVRATACPATFGTSGAPVLQSRDGTWRVVGVVSAIGNGRTYFAGWAGLPEKGMSRWMAD